MANLNLRRDENINEEETIDLLEIVRLLWSKMLILILALTIGITGGALGTVFLMTPQYESSSMIYIYSKSTSITSLADFQIGTQLTVDFQIIAKTREVIEASAREIGINASYDTIINKVQISNPDNSRILKITVTDSNPELACDLSNAIAHQLSLRIAEVMDTSAPSIVERAIVAKDPSSPSLIKNAVIGGFGCFALVCAFLVIEYLLDDTIKTQEDVEKYLKQNVIAIVPMVDSDESKKNKKKNRSKKGSKKVSLAKA